MQIDEREGINREREDVDREGRVLPEILAGHRPGIDNKAVDVEMTAFSPPLPPFSFMLLLLV